MLQSKIKHFCALICHKQPQTAYSRFLWLCYCRRTISAKPQQQRGSILGNVFCIKTGLQFHNSQNRIDSKNGACKTVCISQTCFSLIALSARRNQKYSWIEVLFFCSGCNRLWFRNNKSINIDAMHIQFSTLYFVHLKEEFVYLH